MRRCMVNMTFPSMLLQVALTFLLLGLCCSVVNCDPNTVITSEDCSPGTYSSGDPYGDAVSQVLNNVLTVTPNSQNFDHSTNSEDGNGGTAFAHGTCEVFLTATDCATCIKAAYDEITRVCDGFIGGNVGMADCSISYGNSPV